MKAMKAKFSLFIIFLLMLSRELPPVNEYPDHELLPPPTENPDSEVYHPPTIIQNLVFLKKLKIDN